MNNIAEKNRISCTGCGACTQACSEKCIQMTPDVFGFLYPEISGNCISCGKCLEVCPSERKPPSVENWEKPCYMLTTKNKKLEAKSASGGFCATLASYFMKTMDGVVFGCVMTPTFDVCHQSITSEKDIFKIQGSKYVQSNTLNTFSEAKEILDNGKYVLYMATPCQIAGLKSFLSKDYPNLITVDLICHGVPSGQAFKNYIEYLSKTAKKPVKEYTFRNKTRYDRTGFVSKTQYCQGKAIYKKPSEDIFFGLFSKGKIYRRSCYSCQYACIQREGDFTCGDCGSRNLYNDFLPYEAMSSLILNNEKALSLWEDVQHLFDFMQIDFETEVKRNKQLRECTTLPMDRDKICKAMVDGKWEMLRSEYLSNVKRSFLQKISGRIPISFKRRFFRIIRFAKKKIYREKDIKTGRLQ